MDDRLNDLFVDLELDVGITEYFLESVPSILWYEICHKNKPYIIEKQVKGQEWDCNPPK